MSSCLLIYTVMLIVPSQFGNQQDATRTTVAQPSGIVPSGLPDSGSGSEGGFGGSAQESGRPHGSGTVPSGVAGGAQPSGGFGGYHGHHGHHGGQGGQGGFPSGGAQPSGSFSGFGQGGESGAAPTAVPSGTFGGSSGQETGFVTVTGTLPTDTAVPETGSSSEGTQSFERIHARQVRPFAI